MLSGIKGEINSNTIIVGDFNTLTSLVAQVVKVSAYNAGNPGSIPWLGRSPEEGNGNPLQYSCLENPMDRGAWLATVHGGHKELDMTERLHFHFNTPLTPMHRPSRQKI